MEYKAVFPEEYEETRKLAERIPVENIAPHASKRDLERTFPWDSIRTLGEAGLLGLVVSEDQGGFGIVKSFQIERSRSGLISRWS